MSEIGIKQTSKRVHIGPLQIGIILSAVFTAGVHLYRALLMSVLRPPRSSFGGGAGGGGGRGFGGGGRGLGAGGGAPSGPMSFIFGSLTTLFYLNALAYILLVIALYLPPLGRYHRIVRWLLVALAVVTIIAWFVIAGPRYNLLAYIDKPVEILLIVLLVIEDRQDRVQQA